MELYITDSSNKRTYEGTIKYVSFLKKFDTNFNIHMFIFNLISKIKYTHVEKNENILYIISINCPIFIKLNICINLLENNKNNNKLFSIQFNYEEGDELYYISLCNHVKTSIINIDNINYDPKTLFPLNRSYKEDVKHNYEELTIMFRNITTNNMLSIKDGLTKLAYIYDNSNSHVLLIYNEIINLLMILLLLYNPTIANENNISWTSYNIGILLYKFVKICKTSEIYIANDLIDNNIKIKLELKLKEDLDIVDIKYYHKIWLNICKKLLNILHP